MTVALRWLFMTLVLLQLSGCGINNIPTYDEQVSAAWSQVLNQHQRRAELIPNLVSTVKGYAAQEKDVLTAVVEARSKVAQTQLPKDVLTDPAAFKTFQDNQAQLSSALARLMVVVERYPDLKANQNFLDLQNQLEGTENRINVARQRYNAQVEAFNSAVRRFPNSITNSLLLHLERKEYFKAQSGAEKAPEVKF